MIRRHHPTRRTFALASLSTLAPGARAATDFIARLKASTSRATTAGGDAAPGVYIDRHWRGAVCTIRLTNRGRSPVSLREAVLFSLDPQLPGSTELYTESFQMLSQTEGTLAEPRDLGYSEPKHYRIPQPGGVRVATGMMLLTPPAAPSLLLAFTSCRRFIGRFYLAPSRLDVVIDLEGLPLAPGESWTLEEFTAIQSPDRSRLLDGLAARINQNHPPLRFPQPPTGWCSWYCFGPRVTARQVLDNLDAISTRYRGLRYVQIDDGYQPAMGDWLEPGPAFGGDLRGVLKEIRKRGFEPAIWVAPFIAEEKSRLFQNHPEWFIQSPQGGPLRSDTVTFGGWRHGPWYALDGTHPAVQQHFENLFRVMRRDWGCTYFKLDANFWGAMHGGRFHDARATRVDAYRRGMQAILRGAGDSFILGCNHPVWPSFGVIHGSRSSGDISRRWPKIRTTARENLFRTWQNGALWWNDPDAIVLTGELPLNEFLFHATAIFASGGMILSGDDLTAIPPDRAARLMKLLPPTGVAARFSDNTLSSGVVTLKDATFLCLFNWTEQPQTLRAALPGKWRATDYWSGDDMGSLTGSVELTDIPPHSARLLRCTRA